MALAPGFRIDFRESLYRMIGALLMYEDEALVRTLVQAGAECVISKTASSSELLDVIRGCRARPKNR